MANNNPPPNPQQWLSTNPQAPQAYQQQPAQGYPQQPVLGYPQQPVLGYPQQPVLGYPQQPAPAHVLQPAPGYVTQPPGYQPQPQSYQQPSNPGYSQTYQQQAQAYVPAQPPQYSAAVPSWQPAPPAQYQPPAPTYSPMPAQWSPQQPSPYNTVQLTSQQLQEQINRQVEVKLQEALQQQMQLQRLRPVEQTQPLYDTTSWRRDLPPPTDGQAPRSNDLSQKTPQHTNPAPSTRPKDESEEIQSLRAEVIQLRLRLNNQLREEQTQAKEASLIEKTKASNEVAVNENKEQDSRESALTPEKLMAPDPSTAWTVVFDHRLPITREKLLANVGTYTTASLKRCVDDVPVLISDIQKKLGATLHLPYLNQNEQTNKKNLDDAMCRWQGIGSMC